MDLSPTKLDYFDDTWKLQSQATILSSFKVCFFFLLIITCSMGFFFSLLKSYIFFFFQKIICWPFFLFFFKGRWWPTRLDIGSDGVLPTRWRPTSRHRVHHHCWFWREVRRTRCTVQGRRCKSTDQLHQGSVPRRRTLCLAYVATFLLIGVWYLIKLLRFFTTASLKTPVVGLNPSLRKGNKSSCMLMSLGAS